MSRVAERAQASKATLYRRWPDRHALVLATLHFMQERDPRATQITGDLREDLLCLLREQVEALARSPIGPAIRGLMSDHRAVSEDLRRARLYGPVLDIFEASGAITHVEAVPRTIVNLGVDLVSHHYFVTGLPLDDADLVEIVDLVWIPALTRR